MAQSVVQEAALFTFSSAEIKQFGSHSSSLLFPNYHTQSLKSLKMMSDRSHIILANDFYLCIKLVIISRFKEVGVGDPKSSDLVLISAGMCKVRAQDRRR
ncbi:hypothetical protein PoB_004740400 [Plakobranchus ocellatus]|uniref:Uncharacterized protein n=1 Tax=Plakobranchus ocellatus TaxID=259542 RepID=A0AAV4BL70_9GAST|nr:hypothetical protein PoB_004740400 [Plakobranchus ocellatus]